MRGKISSISNSVGEKLTRSDIFGQPVPVNYDGEDTFKTLPGGCLSVLFFITVLSYFLMKLNMMVNEQDWTTTSQRILAPKQDLLEFINFTNYSNITMGLEFHARPGQVSKDDIENILNETKFYLDNPDEAPDDEDNDERSFFDE